MDDFLRRLLEMEPEESGCFPSASCAYLLQRDDIYAKDLEDLEELENKYAALDLTDDQRRLVNDYNACVESVYERERDISYLAGIRDAISFMSRLELLKT